MRRKNLRKDFFDPNLRTKKDTQLVTSFMLEELSAVLGEGQTGISIKLILVKATLTGYTEN